MRYIITGANSFIGLELIKHLIKQEEDVYAVCRKNNTKIDQIPSKANIIHADMAEYADLQSQIHDADIFINLAWEGTGGSGRNAAEVQHKNIQNTLHAIEAAKKMGCQVFVESGSQAEYGTITSIIKEDSPCNPFSEYGKAKLSVKNQAFQLCEELGIKYVHLRIFSVFGENDHPWTLIMSSTDKMLRNENVDLSSCNQYWNFLYVKDAVEQIVRLCTHVFSDDNFRHDVYNIASNDTRVLKEFVEEIKFISHSNSKLNYGALTPTQLVSLRPDITRLTSVTKLNTFTPFSDVINLIIKKLK